MSRAAGFLPTLTPYVWGSWFCLGYWGVGGLYLGFINVFFKEIGLNAGQIGILSALTPLLGVTLAPLVAGWADRRAKRVPLVVWGLVGLGVALIALFFARGFWAVLAVFVVLAAFSSFVAPVADGLIARMAVRHGLEYGQMRLWGSLSFAVTSAIFGLVWDRFGYAPMFLAAGIAFLVFAPTAARLEEGAPSPPGQRFNLASGWQDRGLVLVLLLSLMMGLGLGLSSPFLGVNIERLGGSALHIGLLFGAIAIAEVPVMRLERHLARVVGDAGVLALGCLSFALVYGSFTFIQNPNVLIWLGVFEGVGFALFIVGTVRIVDERATQGRSSTWQAVRNGLSFGIAPLLASPLGGVVFDARGPWVFAITSVVMLAGAAVALLGRRALRAEAPEA